MKIILCGSNLLCEKNYMVGSENISSSNLKYKPSCSLSTNHSNKITVIDVPFCQHAVIKFLVTDSSLAAHMVDKLCSVYGGFCFSVPTLCGTG
jgi:hypothetical protein